MHRWFTSIARNYGRKTGLLRHWWYWRQYRLGLPRRFQAVDWDAVGRLVSVCQGNICRSPYAESRARAVGLRSSSVGLHAGLRSSTGCGGTSPPTASGRSSPRRACC